MQIKALLKIAGACLKRHAPAILLATGIGAGFTAAGMACKATLKAKDALEEAAMQKAEELDIAEAELTTQEKLKVVVPIYAPSVALGVASSFLIVGAHRIDIRRNAALLAAYELSESSLKTWKDKTSEKVDEKTYESIQQSIAEQRFEDHPLRDEEIFDTGRGDRICMDSITGRYFRSSIQRIEDARNNLNALLLEDGRACLNDFYDFLGLPPSDIGYVLGWNANGKYDLVHTSTSRWISMPNGDPCMVVEFDMHPDYDYRDY